MIIHSNKIIEKKTDPKFQYFKISPFRNLDFTVSLPKRPNCYSAPFEFLSSFVGICHSESISILFALINVYIVHNPCISTDHLDPMIALI